MLYAEGEPDIFFSQRGCVPGKSVRKRALQVCNTTEMTSGLFNKVARENWAKG